MTEFLIKPYRQVQIKILVKIGFEEFQKRRTLEENPPKWCEGVLFAIFPAPETVDTVQDELAGIQHWLYAEVCEMEKKIPMLKLDGRELPILDVSANPLFVDFANWIKTQELWRPQN